MTDRPPKRAVLIAGATASGKSALALVLAEALGGTIINADAMQVYRDLRIVTARPTPAEEARVPHLLYGHVDAAENYSVGRWCVDASAALTAVERAGRLPIFVGGTGLYFKALTRGLAAVPPVPVVPPPLGPPGVPVPPPLVSSDWTTPVQANANAPSATTPAGVGKNPVRIAIV